MLEGEKEGSLAPNYPMGKPPSPEMRNYLALARVKNEVAWVNKDVSLPFKLEEGKRCNLGLFLARQKSRKSDFPGEMMHTHHRSALLGRVIFQDNTGRRYRDVGVKGVGYSDTYSVRGRPAILLENPGIQEGGPGGPTGVPGLLDWKYAEWARSKSEFLESRGLRTSKALAIVKLKEIIMRGEKISIAEARRRDIIPPEEEFGEPVILLRAFGTQARITNAEDPGLLPDAIAMVAQELGLDPGQFDAIKYCEWFATTLGEQVAILHSANQCHNYLNSQNITLDCRIVDLDSVVDMSAEPERARAQALRDLMTTDGSLTTLGIRADVIPQLLSADQLRKLFLTSYLKRLTNKNLAEDHVFLSEIQRAFPYSNTIDAG